MTALAYAADLAPHLSETAAMAKAVRLLTDAGVTDPVADAAAILDYADTAFADAPPEVFDRCLASLLDQRARRVPLGYLTGSARVLGLEFAAGPGAFVPRRESEDYVRRALDSIRPVAAPRVLDLFSGVGALALIVAHHRPDAAVTAVELSDDALVYAETNRRRRALAGDPPIDLVQADIFDDGWYADLVQSCDLVMANPPYVPLAKIIRPEFARYQPREAIYSGEDGLDAMRAATVVAASTLKPGGWYFVEHGEEQADSVDGVLTGAGLFEAVRCNRDAYGLPRWSFAARTDRAIAP
ncbi:N5-glutamine methyltransferase family protein [Thalassococcus sp. BH17M4-6]|uniref:N5-glutamine methyltransferase family protein n=1 Tax=Thalassococcus sp. BH17M4-6 TaxID=3413148 RepID=UPI003BD24A00